MAAFALALVGKVTTFAPAVWIAVAVLAVSVVAVLYHARRLVLAPED